MTLALSDFRFQWYQTGRSTTIDIFVKNISTADAKLSEAGSEVQVSFKDAQGQEYGRTFRVAGPVNGVTTRVLASKLEVSLTKSTEGFMWPDLELGANGSQDASTPSADISKEHAPSYPTSYTKHKGLDWSKVATEEASREPSFPSEAYGDEAAAYGGDPSEEGDGGSMENFFKKVYSNASDESKRAMNKSFMESKGTKLSSNWEQVSEGHQGEEGNHEGEEEDGVELTKQEAAGKGHHHSGKGCCGGHHDDTEAPVTH